MLGRMNRGLLLLVVVLGCRAGLARNRDATGSTERGPVTAGAGGAATASAPATIRRAQEPATYVTEDEVRRLAAKVTTLKGGRLLVCGDAETTANCVCLEPLPCGKDDKDGKDGCLTLERNLEVFRSGLAGKEKSRKVDCRHAEVGSCGAFRYFAFNGDIERNDLRWFDASGGLVAARSATDYPAYCGGKAHSISGAGAALWSDEAGRAHLRNGRRPAPATDRGCPKTPDPAGRDLACA